jgi:hypothetical protein
MLAFTVTYKPKRGAGPILLGPFSTRRRSQFALRKHRRRTRSALERYVVHETRVNSLDGVP